MANIHTEKAGLVKIWRIRAVRQSPVPLPEFELSSDEFTNLLAAAPQGVRLVRLSGLYGKLVVAYGILLHNLGLGHYVPSHYHKLLCGTMGYLSSLERPLRAIAGKTIANYPPDAQLPNCNRKHW